MKNLKNSAMSLRDQLGGEPTSSGDAPYTGVAGYDAR